jgi:phosphatidate cytidylyltransferase
VLLFASFLTLVSAIGLDEFYRMVMPERRREGLAAALIGALLTIVPLSGDLSIFLVAVTLPALLAALWLLFRFRDIALAAREWSLLAAGVLYVPLLISQLLLLRAGPSGTSWIFLLLIIVMAGDSAAFYVGSAWGRHKLYPAVSPNKSIEGAVGGLAGSVAGAFIARMTFFPQLTPADAIATALLLGLLGQLGDLFESLLKRSCGVKDSGTIIPGHGGILDRLDSILFAAPVAYWYAHFLF